MDTAADSALELIERAVGSVRDPNDRQQRIDALRTINPALVDDVVFGSAASQSGAASDGVLVTAGLGVSPGVGIGQVRRDMAAALDAFDRGEEVVLVVDETGPADEPAMRVATAVVTRRGGATSHAAIVARQWGIPAVCGADVGALDDGETILVDGTTGEVRAWRDGATLDGTSSSADGRLGPDESLPGPLAVVLDWADEASRPALAVCANAELLDDVDRAVRWGAAGVGLCRTEHQFLGAGSETLAALVGSGAAAHHGEVAAFVERQRLEIGAILAVLGDRPLRVRLLDAPTHEFGIGVREHNPMLGVRGVRLAITAEPLLRAQVSAVAHAVADALAVPGGASPSASITVPMVALHSELVAVRAVIDDEVARVAAARGVGLQLGVGVMIETPRAALIADLLAREVDYFSFGTNDLTQLTYGLSRDDVDSTLLVGYVQRGLVDRSPFETLDELGVARLIALAAQTGRAANPELHLSLCGEHGGDPSSIGVAVRLGLHEVSVSPYRVPATRLAAAHAVIENSSAPGSER